ncbi:MAG: DUF2264 domain-containing protein [Deltaproteobacteria bacterium]
MQRQGKTRRRFMKAGLGAAAAYAGRGSAGQEIEKLAAVVEQSGTADRDYWCSLAGRLASPVLRALSRRRLKIEMPVETAPTAKDRPQYTHLEALGRLLCGIAPWLELAGDETREGRDRARLADLARTGLDAATDPASPDHMNFSAGHQPLVDAAFLAQAILRAPGELWHRLPHRVQANVIASLKETRAIKPSENNWLLFATTVEVFMHRAGEPTDEARLLDGLRTFRDWYLGDGLYGDGPEFHCDYYNSFVIHPMLIEALDVVRALSPEWQSLWERETARLTRWAAIQERLIAPDGSYPAIGRSLAYRCGAFQGLALAALRHALPAELPPGQARCALTAVIRRTLDAPGTWNSDGWLQIGLDGHQPGLGERYISTGSLYLCSAALLPLGLPASDAFWTGPAAPTSWEKVWSGRDLPADHALPIDPRGVKKQG